MAKRKFEYHGEGIVEVDDDGSISEEEIEDRLNEALDNLADNMSVSVSSFTVTKKGDQS